MTKVYKQKVVTKKQSYRVKTVCDLCGRESPGTGWTSELFEIDETELKVRTCVRRKKGSNYLDGGWGTEIEVDICPDCFKGKLVPWLKSQGVEIEEREWEW